MTDDFMRQNEGKQLTMEQKERVHNAFGPEASTVASVPSKEAATPLQVWKVTITQFRDQHRHNGSDWSKEYASELFAHQKDADTFLRRTLIGFIEDRFNEDDCDKEINEYPNTFTSEGYLQREYRIDCKTVEAIAQKLAIGTYVPRTLSWQIDKCAVPSCPTEDDEEEMDDDEPEPADSCDMDDDDNDHEISKHEVRKLLEEAGAGACAPCGA
jgi:hypothetical protein